MIDFKVIKNFIYKEVIWWLRLLMKAINAYKLLMMNKQVIKQEMIDKKVNINVRVLRKWQWITLNILKRTKYCVILEMSWLKD